MGKKLFHMVFLLGFYVTLSGQVNVDSIYYLDEVMVNADRTNIYQGKGRIVYTIDESQIKLSSATSLDDLLVNIAGLDARRRGIYGVQSDLSIRGGTFDQVLVLLNGINITDPQTGHYNMDIPLDIADISRIEILQGSAARLLGSNAFSGAINIITGENIKNQISSRSSVGSHGFLSQNMTYNLFSGSFQSFTSVTHKASDGYIENTDFDITSIYSRSKLRSNNIGTFDIQMASQFKAYGANSFYSTLFPDQFENTKTFLASLGWNYSTKTFKLAANSYWRRHNDRFELFRNYQGAELYSWYEDHNYHQTDVTGGKFTITDQWIGGSTTIGMDLRNEHIYSNVLGNIMDSRVNVPFESNKKYTREDNRFLTNFFIDHTITIADLDASAGIGITSTRQFGSDINGGIDVRYNFGNFSRVFLSVNSAVRLPTFTDLYYISANQISNPDLKPEKSTTFELGAKTDPDNLSLSATGYYRIGRDIIDWVKFPDSEVWESSNWTAINAYGMDLSIIYRPDKLFIRSISTNYSFLGMNKETEGIDSKYALDYQKHKVVLEIHHDILSKLSVKWNCLFIDRAGNFTDFFTGETMEYKSYFLIKSRFAWDSDRVVLFTDINNILDVVYNDFGGLKQPGINIIIGIQITGFD